MSDSARRVIDATSCAMVFLALTMGAVVGRSITRSAGDGPTEQTVRTLDPNVAPWWELAALPELGRSLSQSVVAHRRGIARDGGEVAFDSPADLLVIRGIGPKTVERLTPYFRRDAG